MKTSTKTTHKPKKTAGPSLPPVAGPLFPTDDPASSLPRDVELFPHVQTLADLGLTEARAYALSQHTHSIGDAITFDGMACRSRALFESFGFAVTLVNVRDEEEMQGDVFVFRTNREKDGRWTVDAYGIGTIDLHTGRFVDNIELSEREYATPLEQKGAA